MAGASERRSTRRTVCQDWDEYFMAMAFLSAKLSRNSYIQVGACIVNNNKEIVGIGYNGVLRERDDSKFYWHRNPFQLQPLYVPHAEINALHNRNSGDVKDCTIYVTLFPCDKCADEIIKSGIKKVVFLSDMNIGNYKTIHAKQMFDNAGVTYRPMKKKIEINFSDIDCNKVNQSLRAPMEREDPKVETEDIICNILFDPNYYTF